MKMGEWINKRVGLGLLMSVFVLGLLEAIAATLMNREVLPVSIEQGWVIAAWAIAALIGGRFACKGANQHILHGCVQGIMLYLLAWGISFCMMRNTNFSINGWKITAAIIGGSILSSLFREKGRKARKVKTHHKSIKRK